MVSSMAFWARLKPSPSACKNLLCTWGVQVRFGLLAATEAGLQPCVLAQSHSRKRRYPATIDPLGRAPSLTETQPRCCLFATGSAIIARLPLWHTLCLTTKMFLGNSNEVCGGAGEREEALVLRGRITRGKEEQRNQLPKPVIIGLYKLIAVRQGTEKNRNAW
jgi:hypothetical protein